MRTWTERDAAHAIRGLDAAPVQGACGGPEDLFDLPLAVGGCCGVAGSPASAAPAPAPAPATAKMVDVSSVDCKGYWWYRYVPTGTQLAVGGFVLGLGYRAWKKIAK